MSPRPSRRPSPGTLLACFAALGAVVAYVHHRRPTPATPVAGAAHAGSATIHGVPRRLLYRGHEEAMAAREAYLGDAAERSILRALDERTEAWEVRGLRFPRLARGPTARREVLLTFDDGPDPVTTPRVLDILHREQVPAVFFLVGRRVDEHPELARREVAEGHTLGNHTWHHAYLTRMEPDCMRAQIEATGNAIRAVTGRATHWFRPPGGHYDPEVARTCRELGQTMVLWNDTPGDWLRPSPQAIEARGLRFLKPGAIILLHDTLPETVAMLPDFIHRVRAHGYRFVPISRFEGSVVGR